MNSMLDSSSLIEALALNYASFGVFTVVNNLWTWVAVITAAISFWRFRTTSFSDKPDHHHQTLIHRNTSGSRQDTNSCVEPPSPSPAPVAAVRSVNEVKDLDFGREGTKYTLYYYEEEQRERNGEVTVGKEWRDDDDDGNGVSCCAEWRDWERSTMRGRMGDVGWYRYQDLTVFNGNVVRLWEDNQCRRRSKRSCCYNSRCAVGSKLVN